VTFHLSPGCTINVSEGGCQGAFQAQTRVLRVRWAVTAHWRSLELMREMTVVASLPFSLSLSQQGSLKADTMLKRIPEISFSDLLAHASYPSSDGRETFGWHTYYITV